MPFEPLKNYSLDFFTIPQSCKQEAEGSAALREHVTLRNANAHRYL